MIRLALALGFISVFGIVSYVAVVLLKDHFNRKNETLNKTKTEHEEH
jgi:hypothetical protein